MSPEKHKSNEAEIIFSLISLTNPCQISFFFPSNIHSNPKHQLLIISYHLILSFSSNIIPHLEIVAGDASYTLSTSNNILYEAVKRIVSPLERQSFLLSSRTVFKFSIHNESIGPLNKSQ